MLKKVLIVTYYFPPSGGAGVQRWLKFSKYLPENGVEPVVLTVDPAYASYPQIDETLLSDVPEGLKVVRTRTREVLSLYKKVSPTGELPHTGFANEKNPTLRQKISRFIRGNFFLPDPRRGWNRFALKEAVRLIEEEGIDTVVTTSPPHSTQLIGLELKRRFPNIKWVADLRDPWSDIYFNKDLYQTSLAKWCNRRLERSVLEHADAIVTVSGDCVQNFKSKTTKSLNVELVMNGYDEGDFGESENCGNGESVNGDILSISYVGSIGPQYETETFINALKLLSPEIQSKIHLTFVGGGSSIIEPQLSAVNCKLSTVNYLPHKEAVKQMCSADLLLLLLPEQPENKGIVTGKLFEYMASGNPVLAICYPDGNAANILNKYEKEGVFAFGEAQKTADYITRALEQKLMLISNPETPVDNTVFATNADAAKAYSRRVQCGKMAELLVGE